MKDARKEQRQAETVKAVQFGVFPELGDMSTQLSSYENNPHAQSAMADLNAAANAGHRRADSLQVPGSF